jgi:hypothetical protein
MQCFKAVIIRIAQQFNLIVVSAVIEDVIEVIKLL